QVETIVLDIGVDDVERIEIALVAELDVFSEIVREAQLAVFVAGSAANKDRALGCEQAIVNRHLSVDARDGERDVALCVAIDRVPTTEDARPVRTFAIAVEARRTDVATDRVIDLAAGGNELFSDLAARGAGTDNQNSTLRELIGIAIVDRMDLHDRSVFRDHLRIDRRLEGTG